MVVEKVTPRRRMTMTKAALSAITAGGSVLPEQDTVHVPKRNKSILLSNIIIYQ